MRRVRNGYQRESEREINVRLQEAQAVTSLTLEEMVEELVQARDSLASQQATVYYIERAVVEAMQERGATVVRTDGGEATLTTPVSYDYGILAQLRAIIEDAKIPGNPKIQFKAKRSTL